MISPDEHVSSSVVTETAEEAQHAQIFRARQKQRRNLCSDSANSGMMEGRPNGQSNPNPVVAGVLGSVGRRWASLQRDNVRKALPTYRSCLSHTSIHSASRSSTGWSPKPVGNSSIWHILLAGIIAVFVVAAYAWFHIANIVDAARSASSIRAFHALPRMRHKPRILYRPYTRPYIYCLNPGSLLRNCHPLAFGILLAFTNYNLYCPPAGRFDCGLG